MVGNGGGGSGTARVDFFIVGDGFPVRKNALTKINILIIKSAHNLLTPLFIFIIAH